MTFREPVEVDETTLAIFVALAAATAGCSADDSQQSSIENEPTADAGHRDGGTRTADGGVPAVDRSHMEVCGNGLDDDHNNLVDDGCACLSDQNQRCFPGDPALAGVGQCVWGHKACTAGSELGIWGACEGAGSPSAELCDGVDNDCNGRIDEGCTCTVGETRPCYGGPPGTQDVGTCRAGTQTCVADGGSASWGACTGDVTPAPAEACDGQDHTCNGTADEGCYCPPGQTAVFTRIPGGGASGVIAAAGSNGLFTMTCEGSGCAPGQVQVSDPMVWWRALAGSTEAPHVACPPGGGRPRVPRTTTWRPSARIFERFELGTEVATDVATLPVLLPRELPRTTSGIVGVPCQEAESVRYECAVATPRRTFRSTKRPTVDPSVATLGDDHAETAFRHARRSKRRTATERAGVLGRRTAAIIGRSRWRMRVRVCGSLARPARLVARRESAMREARATAAPRAARVRSFRDRSGVSFARFAFRPRPSIGCEMGLSSPRRARRAIRIAGIESCSCGAPSSRVSAVA